MRHGTVVLEDFRRAAKQSRSKSGFMPGKVWFSARPFEPQAQNQRRQQSDYHEERNEESCGREQPVGSHAPKDKQDHIGYSKRD
jgi:hypothetical protein